MPSLTVTEAGHADGVLSAARRLPGVAPAPDCEQLRHVAVLAGRVRGEQVLWGLAVSARAVPDVRGRPGQVRPAVLATLGCALLQDDGFRERAAAFLLGYLEQHGVSSGELVTDAAKLAGIRPPDDRAFGPVYAALARKGRIVAAGFCARRKGHGTAGGRLWRLA